MPKNKNRRWFSIKKDSTSGTASNQLPGKTDIPSWSIYRSIHELPLSRWIDVSVDGYLRALVKEGNPPELELKLAEHELRIQYSDAAGDHQYRLYVNLVNEISRLEILLKQIESLINTLRDVYNPVLAKELNSLLSTSFKLDISKPEEYDKLLDRCYRRSRGYNVTIALKKTALAEMEKKYQGQLSKPSREYYMGSLIALSDDAGYPLSDQITVWEFLERIKRYNKKFAPPLKRKKNG